MKKAKHQTGGDAGGKGFVATLLIGKTYRFDDVVFRNGIARKVDAETADSLRASGHFDVRGESAAEREPDNAGE